MKNTKNTILWITRTAVMLALLISLQAITKPLGQYVTGSCVNTVLAVTVLVSGLSSGLTVALLSPLFAYLFGIAPQVLVIPAIMAGNALYVLLLSKIWGRDWFRQAGAVAIASLAKFAALYLLVSKVVCGLLFQTLVEKGMLKTPAKVLLTAQFSWPQLVTALIGGVVAMAVVPLVRKALKK